MTVTKIDIFIVQLENPNGTRVKVGGYPVDKELIKQEFSTDDDATNLKTYIIKTKASIPDVRSKDHIRLYIRNKYAFGNSQWETCEVSDALVNGRCYGYIDLERQQDISTLEIVTAWVIGCLILSPLFLVWVGIILDMLEEIWPKIWILWVSYSLGF